MSSRVSLESVGSNRWRVSVVCFSGHVAAVEGDFRAMTRLALRAERMFAVWAHRNASRTTVPPPTQLRLRTAGERP